MRRSHLILRPSTIGGRLVVDFTIQKGKSDDVTAEKNRSDIEKALFSVTSDLIIRSSTMVDGKSQWLQSSLFDLLP